MYNTEQKNRFVNTLNDETQRKAKNIFSKTEAAEELREMDCSLFNINEITGMYSSMLAYSVDTLTVFHTILRKYTDWCMSEGLLVDGVNHYKEIPFYDLNKCIAKAITDKQIFKREEVYQYAEQLRNPYEQVLLLASYEGLVFGNAADVYNISSSIIKDGEFTTSGWNKQAVSDKLLSYIKAAEAADRISLYGSDKEMPFGGALPPVFKPMYNGKEYTDETQILRYFCRILNRIKGIVGVKKLSVKMLHESGRIEMINYYAQKDGISVEEVMSRYGALIEKQYGQIVGFGHYKAKYTNYLAK